MTAVELRREGPVWPQSMPPEWRLLKFSWVVDIAEGQIHPEDTTYSDCVLIAPNHIESGTGRLIAKETASEQGAISGKYRCRRGDVVYSKIRPALRKATIADEDCLCSADMYPLRPRELLASRYLLYLIVSGPFTEWAVLESDRVAMPKINRESLNDLRIPVPPTHVQDGLVAFLDPRVSEVDSLVAAKQRLLDLLAEKRKAIIATAVTRGLDPKAKLRDSGVPWLGEIPAHWDMTRLKFVTRVQTGIALGKDYAGQATSEFPYLRVANVQDGFIDLSEVKTMAVPEREAASATLRRGDVLMNEGGDADKLGRGAIWDASINPCLHQNHVFALRPMSVSSEWLSTWTGSEFAKAYFETKAKQSTNLASISSTNLLELPIAVPPGGEQHVIVEHIARETAKLDAVRAATERTIALLKERRAALIAAAVTGQIDVGTAA